MYEPKLPVVVDMQVVVIFWIFWIRSVLYDNQL